VVLIIFVVLIVFELLRLFTGILLVVCIAASVKLIEKVF